MSNILTNNINPRSGNTITIGGVNDIVSIAGTIAYDDVTNVDAVGIITAQGGLKVGPLSGIGITFDPTGFGTFSQSVTIGGRNNQLVGEVQIYRGNPTNPVFGPQATVFVKQEHVDEASSSPNYGIYNIDTSSYIYEVRPDGDVRTNSKVEIGPTSGIGITLSADGDGSYIGVVTAQYFRTKADGGIVIANYNLVTESTAADVGLFIGSSDPIQSTAANSNASIRGDGSARLTTLYVGTNSGIGATVNTDGTSQFGGVVTQKGATIMPSNTSGGIYVRNVANDGNVATILGDGSSTFNSTLQVGGNALNGAAAGVQLWASGSVHATQSAGASTVFAGYTVGSTTKTSIISANGGATFAAGEFVITPGAGTSTTSSSGARTNINGDGIYQLNSSGTVTGQILANGEARFSTLAKVGPESANVGDNAGATILENGAVHIMNTTSNNSVDLVAGYGAGTKTFHIHSNGSAEFTNELRMFRSGTDNATRINLGGSDTHAVWQNEGNFIIKYDGSADFNGTFKKNTSAGALVCAITDDYLRVYDAPASLNDFKISLEKAGTGRFTGEIGIGTNYTNSNVNASGTWLSDVGRITLFHSTNEGNPFFRGTKNNGAGGSTEQFVINDDGSAKFGSGTIGASSNSNVVQINSGYGQIQIQSDSGGNALYRGYNSDGTITFTVKGNGDITTGDYDNSSNGHAGIELGAAGACSVQRVNGTADAAVLFIGYRGSDDQFQVQATGQIYSRASTSITLIGSERRLKRDIETIDPVVAWKTIRDLPYYQYKLIGSERISYGPIVDECPQEMIMEGPTEDEQGNIRTYDNSLLQGRLFVALQNALTRIEALEAKVQQLEG